MEKGDDPYEILGLAKTASAAEIKKAYRQLAIKFHPDKNPDDKSASDMFSKVSAAYEILSDEEKRQQYDICQQLSPGSGFETNKTYKAKKQKPSPSAKPSTQAEPSSFPSPQPTRSSSNNNMPNNRTTQPHHSSPKSFQKQTTNRTQTQPQQPTYSYTIPPGSDPQKVFKQVFAKEIEKDPDFLKKIKLVNKPKTTAPTTTCGPCRKPQRIPVTKKNTSKPMTVRRMSSTQQPQQQQAKQMNNGVQSMSTNTRTKKHPDGRTEYITETTTTYFDGRTEMSSKSSFGSPTATTTTRGRTPVLQQPSSRMGRSKTPASRAKSKGRQSRSKTPNRQPKSSSGQPQGTVYRRMVQTTG